jgi:5'-nucleotidase
MSSESLFVLGVDLDGVCGAYEDIFRKVVSAETGVPEADIPPQIQWDFAGSGWPIRSRAHYEQLHQLGITKYHMFATMPAIPGASDALWRLSDIGVRVRLITHRLLVSWEHATAINDTVTWLNQPRESDAKPLIPYRDLCFMGDKTEVGADLYVEDAPHNVEALRREGDDVICYDHLYNRDVLGLRANNWDEVEQIVRQRLDDRGLLTPKLR